MNTTDWYPMVKQAVARAEAAEREVEAAFIRGVESVMTVRCVKHVAVPPRNTNEAGGGECGACIAEEGERLQDELEGMRIEARAFAGAMGSMAEEAERLRAALEVVVAATAHLNYAWAITARAALAPEQGGGE